MGVLLVVVIWLVACWRGTGSKWLENQGTAAALSVVLLSTSVLMTRLLPSSRATRTAGVVAAILAVVASSSAASWIPLDPAWKAGRGFVAMSPMAQAFVGLLAGIHTATLMGLGRNPCFRQAGLMVTGLITLVCLALGLGGALVDAQFAAQPPLSVVDWLDFTLAALGFSMCISCGLPGVVQAGLGGVPPQKEYRPSQAGRWLFPMVAGGLALLIGSGAWLHLKKRAERTREEFSDRLAELAGLKVEEIGYWLGERRNDARTLSRFPILREILTSPEGRTLDGARRERLRAYLAQYRLNSGYSEVAVLDKNLKEVVSTPPNQGNRSQELAAETAAARDATDVTIVNPHPSEAGPERVDFVAPIRTEPAGAFAGAIVLRMDPAAQLARVAGRSPTQSPTVENMLMREEGGEAVYVTPTRPAKSPNANLQSRPGRTPTLATQALSGQESKLLEGLDYRGVDSLGVRRGIPGTSWALVSKVDASDLEKVVRGQTIEACAGLTMMLALLGLGAGSIYRQRKHELEAGRWEAERARTEIARRLGIMMMHAQEGVILFDEQWRVVECNPRAAAMHGVSPEGMLQLSLGDLCPQGSEESWRADIQKLSPARGGMFHHRHRRSDGSEFETEVSAGLMEAGGRSHALFLLRDTTERRAAEREISRLNRMYRSISQVNQALLKASSQEDMFHRICRIIVQDGGFMLVMISWPDPETGLLIPLAVDGPAKDYAKRVRISTKTGEPEGRGPSGQAFREERTMVCNDFQNDESTAPWHEAARAEGIASNISLPLTQGNRVCGMFSIYAGEKDCFGLEEVVLLEEAAANVAFAVGIFDNEKRRKAAEKALRESEERYRIMAENTLDVVWMGDLQDGLFEYVSQSMFRMCGYRPEELVGKPRRMILSEASSDWVFPDIQLRAERLQAGDASARDATYEVVYQRKDGGTLDAEVITTLMAAPGVRAQKVLGVARDVTARKRAERHLGATVKYLQALNKTASWLDEPRLSRDEALARIMGEVTSITRDPARARASITLDGVARGEGPGGAPHTGFAADIVINGRRAGEIVVSHTGEAPPPDPDGLESREREAVESIARTLGLGLGARESLEAVRRLNAELEDKVKLRTTEIQARNQEVGALLSAIPDTILRLDPGGRVINWQPARDYQGPSAPAVSMSADHLDSLSPRFVAACAALGRRSLETSRLATDELEDALPGGSVTLELRAAPIGPEGCVVFIRDITVRKRAEAETAARLEKERQISEMKTRFISVTSHEFRTPMAAVMGSCELLANHFDRIAPPKREELFDRIQTSIHRMTEMLDDVLTLSRMDAKRTQAQLSQMELRRFASDILEETRLGDHQTHRFELQAPSDQIPVVSDPNLLRHIISNLLSNAVRYSPAGTTVTLRLEVEGSLYRIMVEDHGIGIPVEDRGRLFEPFERGSNVGVIKGTGLGLSIVKRTTEMLGGVVRIEEAAGGGTRFIIQFPQGAPRPA